MLKNTMCIMNNNIICNLYLTLKMYYIIVAHHQLTESLTL